MSGWFKDRRQEFISATLRQFGQIRRADIMRQFDLSEPQASKDIATFLAKDPPFVAYDTTLKAYVLNEPPKGEPDCAMCDDTGFKDHASFAMEPCDHRHATWPGAHSGMFRTSATASKAGSGRAFPASRCCPNTSGGWRRSFLPAEEPIPSP